MRAADYLGYTWRNLTRAQLRLILTVLAVVIGATLVVVMTSIGGGAQRNVIEQVRSLGGLNEIGVIGGAVPMGQGTGPRAGVLNQGAIEAIQTISGVTAVLPQIVVLPYQTQLQTDGRGAQASLIGVPPERLTAYGFTAARGNVAPAPGQVVLGARVSESFVDQNGQRTSVEDLFGQTVNLVSRRVSALPAAPPAGMPPGFGGPQVQPQIQQRDKDLEVVGILQPVGTQDDFTVWLNADDALDTLEWTTGRRPDLATEGYQALRVKTASTEQVRGVQQQITALDLQATSPLSLLDQVNQQMLQLQLLLGAIGLVALIVSGLGVANTMLMATFERTREIGILKALGATEGQIARLFLIEASLIGIVGALAGLLFGWLATQVVNLVLLQMLVQQAGPGVLGSTPGRPPTVLDTPNWVPLVVLAFAWLVAVLAGLYPALRAARLNIASALRAD